MSERRQRTERDMELDRFRAAEEEGIPSPFTEAEWLAEAIEEGAAGYAEARDRILARFYTRAGLAPDARRLQQVQRQQRLRLAVALAMLLVVAIAAVTVIGLLPGWGPGSRTPTAGMQPFESVSDIQPYFSVSLPQEPPAGYQLQQVALEQTAAGPRAAIVYRRDVSGPAGPCEVELLVRSSADAAFSFPAEVSLEPIEVAGRPASWVEGTAGDPTAGQLWTDQGGWLLWETEGWTFALTSPDLSLQELIALFGELVGE